MLKWLRFKTNDRALPSWWQDYLTGFSQPLPDATPLDEVPFVVFDTETTGLDPRSDQILSIGALRLKGRGIDVGDTLELYLHQVFEPVRANIEMHGILPVSREDSMEEREAVIRFLGYVGNSVLIGHHVGFDLAMVNAVLLEMGGQKLRNRTVDTVQIARRLMPPMEHPRHNELSLDQLCQSYGIPLNDRHTAAGDAYLTALLFLKMLARLEKRGVLTLRDLLRKP